MSPVPLHAAEPLHAAVSMQTLYLCDSWFRDSWCACTSACTVGTVGCPARAENTCTSMRGRSLHCSTGRLLCGLHMVKFCKRSLLCSQAMPPCTWLIAPFARRAASVSSLSHMLLSAAQPIAWAAIPHHCGAAHLCWNIDRCMEGVHGCICQSEWSHGTCTLRSVSCARMASRTASTPSASCRASCTCISNQSDHLNGTCMSSHHRSSKRGRALVHSVWSAEEQGATRSVMQ